ncbi:MAG: 4-(cytidine 5'-diphospho)-2-C-methyl-D-erythritol kinase [Actinobacteria bacterium]|nr:4-(cytidine 5'-diphospho)-2-C-methyl-D-erythritol kinase [Actinomycetota bacterium]
MKAYAKVNLALVVGERRADGLHEVATVVQRIDLADEVELEHASGLEVDGFPEDTLVRTALERLAGATRVEPAWRVRITKRIPVAAGLGGGSADAGAVLAAANAALERPLRRERLIELAASVGSDVPFFLEPAPKLAEGAGERLTALQLPQDFFVVVAVERGAEKRSTAEVYSRFDELGGGPGFEERRRLLAEALWGGDLAALPPNDLAAAAGRPQAVAHLIAAGAFRADVSGAGPAAYGLFRELPQGEAAAAELRSRADVWVVKPVW